MLFESVILDVFNKFPSQKLLREKRAVRELLAQKRRMLTKEQVAEYSSQILAQVEQLNCFQAAKTVLIYYPTKNEVDLLPLVKKYKKEKTLLFPVVRGHQMMACPYEGNAKMHRGKYNIPEPTTDPFQGNIDLILVPGVGFDCNCNRLGRGGGYYDRYVQSFARKSVLVGVGYDFQLIEEVPVGRHDKRLDYVVTSTAVFKSKKD